MRVLGGFDLLRFTVAGGVNVVSPSMMFTDVGMAECRKGIKRLLLLSYLALSASASSPFCSGRSRFIGAHGFGLVLPASHFVCGISSCHPVIQIILSCPSMLCFSRLLLSLTGALFFFQKSAAKTGQSQPIFSTQCATAVHLTAILGLKCAPPKKRSIWHGLGLR